MKKIDIIVLCGGLGTRIRSESKGLPKILIKINKDIPFLIYLLKNLQLTCLKNIFLSVGFRGKKIINFIKQNKKLGLKYLNEKSLLGTGGAIKNVLKNKKISDPFFVINGDTFFNFKIKNLIKKDFKNYTKKSIILLKSDEKEKRYDQFKILNNKITFNKNNKNKTTIYINSGLYLFYKKDISFKKKTFSLEKELIPLLISKNRLDFYVNKSKVFFDIGVPKDLNRFKKYAKLNIKIK
jgi:D-glycero-alpha-D-manno-heptose 1-phosphate guanylyltransferase